MFFSPQVEPYHHINPFPFPPLCCSYLCIIYPHTLKTSPVLQFLLSTVKIYFIQLNRRRVYYIYPDIYCFCCYSFIPDVLRFLLVSFLFCFKNFFTVLLQCVGYQQILSVFPNLRIFYFIFIPKGYFG